ncbi:Flap endonuclease 1-A [Colletotrichum orbiculare MAFF 240422]|uniref:Flap endonuclease 1-A n=1 Tax=Colletotrichum orbiculare (strain 104-T / ATCC 96160 / CBS 514.97 / LARS 414 / MAFF 240422) TaxID=1213857 RepID=A0A484G0P4_COLOR|nr:Flap endonuclease 1-A [Colletotrichum orbiculare MAFF 240422]
MPSDYHYWTLHTYTWLVCLSRTKFALIFPVDTGGSKTLDFGIKSQTLRDFTMGIKGIYRELGPGRRVSLARLATEHLESSDRPLRLAVDIAIWQFQTQAARGGTNPAIRTLFYRLVRLLGLGIHPIFVFDGPHKPAFKRNRRSGRGDGVTTAMTKRLIRLFGFPVHDAPGEAEAECALLQQKGIVDAVLSEDVDTIMFGCTRTLRNWTAEGVRGPKTPTHVTLYDVNELVAAGTGLDRQGMVHLSADHRADAMEDMEREEMALVKRVSGRRRHHSTDGMPELRVVYVPAEIVKLDMSNEVDEALSIDRHGLALNNDDGFDIAVAGGEDSGGHNRTGAKHIYDPTITDSVWLPESLVKLSIPLMVEDWEEKQRAKAMRPATNGVSRVKNIKAPQHLGALDQWLQLTRGVAATTAANTYPRQHISKGPEKFMTNRTTACTSLSDRALSEVQPIEDHQVTAVIRADFFALDVPRKIPIAHNSTSETAAD